MAKDVTLADIAAKVGVSTVAVSRALSGKSGVSEDLRNKIKSVAQEMGYVSSQAARTAGGGTGNVGVIIPENYYGDLLSFYGRLYENVVRALYDKNYYGILEILSRQDEAAGKLPKVTLDGKVDGLIFLGQLSKQYIGLMVQQTNLPVMFLDTYIPEAEIDTVISDGYYGTYQMTNYLIREGHRKIGFVGSVDTTSSIADRYWGYRRSLRENGISFQEEWEIPDREENGKVFDRILSSPGELDAYVCNCDYTARILIDNFEKAGYHVPEDVSVVGFDNYLPVALEENRITSYEVNISRMASLCVESLIGKIRKTEYVSGIQTVTGKIIRKKTVKSRK
ncbi:MAG: substrate-binding domain-containing protein [Lachnospiraceae bacterium]|nr:substrate-binding domain-containing protein [Lachnospiraceae bacterium]